MDAYRRPGIWKNYTLFWDQSNKSNSLLHSTSRPKSPILFASTGQNPNGMDAAKFPMPTGDLGIILVTFRGGEVLPHFMFSWSCNSGKPIGLTDRVWEEHRVREVLHNVTYRRSVGARFQLAMLWGPCRACAVQLTSCTFIHTQRDAKISGCCRPYRAICDHYLFFS